MSKITNDDLTRSGTGCFVAVPICQLWASKGLDAAGNCERECWGEMCMEGVPEIGGGDWKCPPADNRL